MIFDAQNLFSDAQAITTSTVSTNVIDFGASGKPVGAAAAIRKDLGRGKRVDLRVQMVEAALAAGAATLTIDLQTDDNEAFSSPKTVFTTGAIAKAQLIAGYVFPLEFFPRGTDERYVRLNYTVATGPLTAGKITAGVVAASEDNNYD
ncbi:Bbp16 family capsid cement protein [Rhizobium sp.]|uniref:Bbp16 family capsid cement protein n=1 Tax=Rhizobium sp. TaxID=391 RepID=UPI0028B141BA